MKEVKHTKPQPTTLMFALCHMFCHICVSMATASQACLEPVGVFLLDLLKNATEVGQTVDEEGSDAAENTEEAFGELKLSMLEAAKKYLHMSTYKDSIIKKLELH